MRHFTSMEARVFEACTPTPARVEVIAARAIVSVKTTRTILHRLVRMKLLTRSKLRGLGGPLGYSIRH